MEMNPGRTYPVAGYDVIATMPTVYGGGAPWTSYVVVLNNNSSHYLVFFKEKLEDSFGMFVESFEYDDGIDEPEYAYIRALSLAVKLAKEN